jgi:hypothetical protein
MFRNGKFARKSLFFTILLGWLLASCDTLTPEVIEKQVTMVVEKEITKEVEVEVLVPTPTPRQASLNVMVMAPTEDEQAVWQDQIDRFEAENPTIDVELYFAPPNEFYEVLLTRIAAGTPPDVTEVPYYHVALFQQQGALQALDELAAEFNVDLGDFWANALTSNTFDDELYALPRLRSACSPRYMNLILPKGSQFHSEAFMLMDFMTQGEQQQENFDRMEHLRWFPRWPTRQSVNDSLDKEYRCDPPARQVLRLLPEDIDRARELVGESLPALEPVLGEQTLAIGGASAEMEGEEILVAAAPALSPNLHEPWLEIVFTETLASGDGVFVGGLFVARGYEIQGVECEPDGGEKPFCEYAVWCWTDDPESLEATCSLVDPEWNEYPLSDVSMEDSKGHVGWPFCTAEIGSPGWKCFNLNSRTICIWIPFF